MLVPPPRRRPAEPVLHQRRRQRPRHRDEPVRRLRIRAARPGLPVHPRPLLPGHALGTANPEPDRARAAGDGLGRRSRARRTAGDQKLNPRSPTRCTRSPTGRSRSTTRRARRSAGFAAPLVATGPGPLTSPATGAYRGSLEFRPDGRGGVQTVDALGLDDYVRGVVAAEMPSSWAAEALEAQAVAARTYAITSSVGGNGYDLYATPARRCTAGWQPRPRPTDAAVAATARADRHLQRRARRPRTSRQLRRPHREHRERVAGRRARAVAARGPGSLRRRRRATPTTAGPTS